MTARGEVLLLADGPAEAAGVPEDEPVPGDVLVDGSLRRPFHLELGGELVAAVAVGVRGPQDVERGAKNAPGAGSGGDRVGRGGRRGCYGVGTYIHSCVSECELL